MENQNMRAVAKPLAERRSTFDRRRRAYRISSASCTAAITDSRNLDSGPSEVAKRCWEILNACLPTCNLDMIRVTDATVFAPDEMRIAHELIRSEFLRHLRGTLPSGSAC
jgi:hypothetical protein